MQTGEFEAITHEFIIPKYKETDFMKFKDELSKSMFETNQNKNDKSLLFDIAFKNSTSFEAVKEKLESNNNIMQEFKNATLKDYEFKLNGDMQKPVELNFIKDIIKPELDSIEAKQDQMAGILQGNVNLLFATKDTPREIMEYKRI